LLDIKKTDYFSCQRIRWFLLRYELAVTTFCNITGKILPENFTVRLSCVKLSELRQCRRINSFYGGIMSL